MIPILSRDQARAFDQNAMDSQGVPSLILMENAGANASRRVLERFAHARRILVLVGRGNNGGDGSVVARHLLIAGRSVTLALACEMSSLTGDALLMLTAFRGLGGAVIANCSETALAAALQSSELVIDALYGTGLTRELADSDKRRIQQVNEAALPVVALDVPSGMDADSGAVRGAAIIATETITFAFAKRGFFTPGGARLTGNLCTVPIGVPSIWARETASAELYTADDAHSTLGTPFAPKHKGEAGRVAIFAGGPGTLGAARLCAHGALRAGAGLVRVATFGEAALQLQSTAWEVMTTALEPSDDPKQVFELLNWADSVVLGPGLGLGTLQRALVSNILRDQKCPVVVDADALTVLSEHQQLSGRAMTHCLLTPHPKEAARLLGCTAPQVEDDRFGAATTLVEKTGAHVLLKGEHTIVTAPDRPASVNTTGNSLLAVGGSGDVLSGVLGAIACRFPLWEAARVGAWLHGAAADAVWQQGHRRGVLARELADAIPGVVASLAAASPSESR